MAKFVDLHNHCEEFSPDSGQPIRERILEAKRASLAGIAMTDHYDKLIDPELHQEDYSLVNITAKKGEWIFHFPEYVVALRNLRQELAEQKDPFLLLRGVELGYHPELKKAYYDLVQHYDNDLDVILASIHELSYLGFKSIYDLYAKEGRDSSYRIYLQELKNMILDMPYTNVLGHFDYISRYNKFPNKKMHYREFSDEFDDLFRTMIDFGVSLEINTGTQYKREETGERIGLPDRDILVRYKELGGERISLCSDAHFENTVGRDFDINADFLQNLGYRYVCHFENQEAVFTPIF